MFCVGKTCICIINITICLCLCYDILQVYLYSDVQYQRWASEATDNILTQPDSRGQNSEQWSNHELTDTGYSQM